MAEAVTVRKIEKKGNPPRVFVAVGKAVSQKAVERNKLKRRIKAITTGLVGKNFQTSVLLSAKKGAAEKSFKELEKEIVSAFRKVV